MPDLPSHLRYVHIEEQGEAFFRVCCQWDLEGIVAKRKEGGTPLRGHGMFATPLPRVKGDTVPYYAPALRFHLNAGLIETKKGAGFLTCPHEGKCLPPL
jgi:hypothetical protein